MIVPRNPYVRCLLDFLDTVMVIQHIDVDAMSDGRASIWKVLVVAAKALNDGIPL